MRSMSSATAGSVRYHDLDRARVQNRSPKLDLGSTRAETGQVSSR